MWPDTAGSWFADAMVELGWLSPNWSKLDAVAASMRARRATLQREAQQLTSVKTKKNTKSHTKKTSKSKVVKSK